MSHEPSRTTRSPRKLSQLAIAYAGACFFSSTVVHAEPSSLPPEVGYNYNEIETGRVAAKGGADRALGSSVSALFSNPANMARSRVYHAAALVQIWPEASRQSYGVGAVDSVGSSSRVAGGVGATWTRQDPDGVDRTASDLRFALAYPLSDRVFIGGGGRFMWLTENGQGPLKPSLASSGLDGGRIVKNFAFDLGLTLRASEGWSLALVGNNLNGADNGFQPLSLGGGIGYVKDNVGFEADMVGDLATWNETRLRAMLGGEVMLGEHAVVRGGYRYDDGARSHAGSLGLGYIDKAFSADLGLRRVLVGDSATTVVLTFTYHVESSGLTPTPSETW
jgi:opacity protein-like surface antigen